MKVEQGQMPIRQYKLPNYPTKQEVLASPDILKMKPKRWDAKPAVCAALTLTLVTGLAGCDGSVPQMENGFIGGESHSRQPLSRMMVPVFEHGSGRGAYGCMMVAPPVFLSEEEAIQVIREEAEAKGIHMTGQKVVPGIRFPAANLKYDDDYDPGTWEGNLALDGYDSALNIGFEFVSQQDVFDWEMIDHRASTFSTYSMKGTADRLADVLENTAVFYDPGEDFEMIDRDQFKSGDSETNRQQYEAAQKELMFEKLRAQVRDFLGWLMAQGVI